MPTSGGALDGRRAALGSRRLINISMEPFRAFVADKLNDEQRTAGFVMQSFFIGLGATSPTRCRSSSGAAGVTGAPRAASPCGQVRLPVGAVAFLLAVLWTVVTSKEYPPEDMEAFERMRREKRGLAAGLAEISAALREMPATMRQLAPVQFFTWLGLFCMWLFFGPAVARHVFGAAEAQSRRSSRDGAEWAGFACSVINIACFGVAFLLPKLAAATSRKTVHAICAAVRRGGLISVYFIRRPVAARGLDGRRRRRVGVHPLDALRDTLRARSRRRGWASTWASSTSSSSSRRSSGVHLRAGHPRPLRPDNPRAPLYVVIIGGGFLLLAALLRECACARAERVPERAVIRGDEHEPLTTRPAQPVPSTGLMTTRELEVEGGRAPEVPCCSASPLFVLLSAAARWPARARAAAAVSGVRRLGGRLRRDGDGHHKRPRKAPAERRERD